MLLLVILKGGPFVLQNNQKTRNSNGDFSPRSDIQRKFGLYRAILLQISKIWPRLGANTTRIHKIRPILGRISL